MRVPRIFIGQPLHNQGQLSLDAKTSHYLSTVLRMDAGRKLVAFCGDGQEYACELITAHKKHAVIAVHQAQTINRESPLQTHLAIGVSRAERFDLVLQKATELGISEITPLHTERTEVKLKGERLGKKMAHWQQILISACEQCQRNTLPALNTLQRLDTFLASPTNPLKLVLHHRGNKNLKQYQAPAGVTLLVGPEGGLTDTEIEQACDANYNPLTLGPRVLRTETAPLVALTAVQLSWGDY